MASLEDARRIAESLPSATTGVKPGGQFFAEVAGKGFAWTWNERVTPGKPRIPCPAVLVVRVANGVEKESLLAADERKFFTEPHYNGFPAVLVRLAEVDEQELRELIIDAWCAKAPKKLQKESGL